MKSRNGVLLIFIAAAFCAIAEAAPSSQIASDTDLVTKEIRELVPSIRTIKDKEERNVYLHLAAFGLTRLGRFEAALEVSNAHTDAALHQRTRDEIWRLTARRLAGQGNIPAALRCANRIQGKFSRADANLAVAQAYQRTGDSGATLRILHRITPDLRATQSPAAVSYLAFLFMQNGDATMARKLFKQALDIPTQDADDSFSDNGKRAIVAYYQAQCGWGREALITAGNQPKNVFLTKAVLTLRRDWALLRDFAETLPDLQAVDFLLDLSGQQLLANERQKAHESLEIAKARFESLPADEKNLKSAFPVQLRLALLEIGNGEKEAGLQRFAGLKASPYFNLNWESAFYYSLIASKHQAVLRLSPEQQTDFEQKAIVLWQQLAKQPIAWVPYGLLDIARAQHQRGALEAARQTLQLEHSDIRNEMVAPTAEEEPSQWIQTRAANRLLSLARARKEMRLDYRLPLAQLQIIWHSDSASADAVGGIQPYSGATKLIQNGFYDEAQKMLENAKFKSVDAEAYGWLPSRAGTYARAKGVTATLEWVRRLPEASEQLFAILMTGAHLTAWYKEKTELTLRGDNRKNLKIDSRAGAPYNALFDLRVFDPDTPIGS